MNPTARVGFLAPPLATLMTPLFPHLCFFYSFCLFHSFILFLLLSSSVSSGSSLWHLHPLAETGTQFPEGQMPQRSGALGLFSYHVSVAKGGAMEPEGSMGTTVSLIWDIPHQGSSSPCNLCERLLCSGHFIGNHMEPPFLMGKINLDGAGLIASSWQGSVVVCPLQPQCRLLEACCPSFLTNLWSTSLWAGGSAAPPTHTVAF